MKKTGNIQETGLLKVLIIDDTMSNIVLFRELVRKIEGCTPICFTEPYEALRWCEEHDPDLILVDYMMPGLNGIDFIQRLRELPDKEATPVIVITAYGEKDVLYRALNQGANDFLTKPIDKTEFVSRVRNMLRLRKGRNELAARTEEMTRDMNELSERIRLMELEHSHTEAELMHAQKMGAIGQLAGGVAHDFNNILSAILTYGTLIKTRLHADSPLHTYTDKLLASSERAGILTKSLLSFSRKQEAEQDYSPCDLNAVVSDTINLLIKPLFKDMQVTLALSDVPLPAMANVSQIEQVLVNIAANAKDAVKNGGSVTIRTEAVVPDLHCKDKEWISSKETKPYALITITDTGIGMNEETRAKIFKPFFTTKTRGKGTGLGLSIVQDIVNRHGGRIDVESEPGRGSSFRIYLPMISAEEKG